METMIDAIIHNSYKRNQKPIDWIAQADDAAAFIGPNADYYINVFKRMDEMGTQKSWNWAAFFAGDAWVGYRKTGRHSATAKPILNYGQPLRPFLFGKYGNWVYKQKVEEELAAAARLDPEARRERLVQRGGVSKTPIIIVLSIALFTVLALFYRDILKL